LSEVSHKKRQDAQTSAAILGYAQSNCPVSWGIRLGQDVHRSIKIPVHELFKQSCTGDVHIAFTSVSDKDNNYNAQGAL